MYKYIDLAKPKSGAPDFITIIITIIMMLIRSFYSHWYTIRYNLVVNIDTPPVGIGM